MAGESGYSGTKVDVTYWLGELRRGVRYRKQMACEDKWDTWLAYYRGRFDPNILPLNIFYKMIRSVVPRVYFRNPSISITPGKPGLEYMVLAQLMERIDNKLLVQMRVKQTMKKLVQDAFMYGTGIGKIGFGAQYTPTPDLIDASAPLGKGKQSNKRLEYHDLVQPNIPWFLRTHPRSFVVPEGAEDIDSSRWAAMWFKRHIDDLRGDPRFKNTSDLKPQGRMPEELRTSSGRGQLDQEGMVELVEIRDKKSGRVIVLAPYATDKVLYDEVDDLRNAGKLPYLPVIFNWDPESFWGVPDSQILDPQQRELNEIRTLVMKHRRLSILKIIMKATAMQPDEIAKLVSEDPAAVAKIQGELTDIKIIEGLSDIPQGLLKSDTLVQTDVRELLGLGANQFGEYAQGGERKSATETREVAQSTQIRTDERRDTMADVLVDLVGFNHEVIFSRWDEDMVLDVAGPMGIPIWVQFQPEVLKTGSYEVNIDPDSAIPETKDVREQRAIQLYGLLRTNPLINPIKLTQYLLHQLHGTQFDDMMQNPMAGPGMSPQNPLQLGQYVQLLPQLLQMAQGMGGGGPPQKKLPNK